MAPNRNAQRSSRTSISLFAYGTLTLPEVLHAVTGRTFAASAAVLPDFARFLLRDRAYPGILPHVGSETTGVLYGDVDPDSLALLDLFEGEIYRREAVRVTTSLRGRIEAETYVVRPDARVLLSARPWSPDEFVAMHLDAFLPHCRDLHARWTQGSRLPPDAR